MRTSAFRRRHLLRHMVQNVEPVFQAIVASLTASDVASFTCSLGINLNGTYNERYLDIIRDMPRYSGWISTILHSGGGITLIGKDLPTLVERISRPDRFWTKYTTSPVLTVWVAATIASCEPIQSHLGEDGSIERTLAGIGDCRTVFIIPDSGVLPVHSRVQRGISTYWTTRWISSLNLDEGKLDVVLCGTAKDDWRVSRNLEIHLEVGASSMLRPVARLWKHTREYVSLFYDVGLNEQTEVPSLVGAVDDRTKARKFETHYINMHQYPLQLKSEVSYKPMRSFRRITHLGASDPKIKLFLHSPRNNLGVIEIPVENRREVKLRTATPENLQE